MRRITMVAILVAAMMAGCIGGPPDELDASSTDAAAPNVWEAGTLSETATAPDWVQSRSRDDRRADVAPPGSPKFAAFDQVIETFMATHYISAASVAVVKDSRLLYENGYGHLDEAASEPTPPDPLFRIASITKPFTATVIAILVEQGILGYDDPVFCLPPEPAPDCRLPIQPHPARPIVDERIADITVRHLVDHQTGWTRGPCTAPLFGEVFTVAEDLDIEMPPPMWRLAQWFMGTPMEFDPGTEPDGLDTYCNMGYGILGLIAEAATGSTIEALYEAYIWGPLEIRGDVEPGFTRPEDRNPREPVYACDYGKGKSIYPPHEEVCLADGAFDMRAAVALGGLIGTPAAIATVYDVYQNDGSLRDDGVWFGGHSGGLPGTATLAWRVTVQDGAVDSGDMTVAVFFNKQTGPDPVYVGIPYQFEILYASLAAAYAAGLDEVPV